MTDTRAITRLSIAEAAAAFRARELTPLELTDAYLDRVERLDPILRCYITVTAEQAREEARRTPVPREGDGPLLGMPLALKDLFDTAGVRTTAGSKILAERVPARDATVVAKLRAAGMVLLGKLNMHEFAYGISTDNPHWGACRNPWDTARVPGGSSGGSAAAMAAGLCAGSLGSDTGGSIRIPASVCGIVGLKPTYGRVSRAGVLPLCWSMDHVGPMTATVTDAAILLQAIAGHDPGDPASADEPVDDYLGGIEGGVRGLRVGLLRGYFAEGNDPAVAAGVTAAADVLRSEGADVRDVTLPGAEDAGLAGDTIMAVEASAYHLAWLRQRPDDYGEDVRARLTLGLTVPGVSYANALRLRTAARAEALTLLTEVDALLAPATPITAPPIDGFGVEQRMRLKRFTTPVNTLGLPALSLPCGFDGAGLPIGMQLIGRPFEEALLLRAGRAYERVAGWVGRRPEL